MSRPSTTALSEGPIGSAIGWLWNRAHLLVVITTLTWGFNTVLGRYVSGEVPPIGLAYMRWLGALIIVLAFAWRPVLADWRRLNAGPSRWPAWGVLAALGFTGVTSYNTGLYIGLQYTEAINALIMTAFGPALVAVFAFLVNRETLSRRQALGIVVSALGVLYVVSRGEPAALLALRINVGDLWVFGGVALYALYSAFLKRGPKLHPMSFLAFTFALGTLFLTPLFVYEVVVQGRTLTFDTVTVLSGLYLMVAPSIFAYLCFNRAVALVGANRVAPWLNLVPLFGSIMAIAWLGESLALFHLLGWGLIVTGIVIASRG